MQIRGIYIKNYRQFKRFHLDFTDPDTKLPVQKICLIGANGTGKSMLLRFLSQFFEGSSARLLEPQHRLNTASFIGFKIYLPHRGCDFFFLRQSDAPGRIQILPGDFEQTTEWLEIWNAEKNSIAFPLLQADKYEEILKEMQLQPDARDLAIYAPADESSLLRASLPPTQLSNALALFKNVPAYHLASYSQIENFWNFLIYQIKKRESDYQAFLNTPEIQSMSVAEAKKRFSESSKEILDGLAKQWNIILENAGLELDLEQVKIPVQLNENLEAFIRFKATKSKVEYNALSTGIRNFIFRIGHIYSLYFNREITRGFLLLDEPEASLYPDLQYDILERYLAIIQNTQLFIATHSPIIAAQFQPKERVILEFDEQGYVHCRKGISPEGDDPNDLLRDDFSVRSLYGKKGLEQWKRYLDLKVQIPKVRDQAQKQKMLKELSKIGNSYNFDGHEISQ